MKKPLLRFIDDGAYFKVRNHIDEPLGIIEKRRVGKFIHWVFCPDSDTFFTNGCLKEIVEFITGLYSQKKELTSEGADIPYGYAYPELDTQSQEQMGSLSNGVKVSNTSKQGAIRDGIRKERVIADLTSSSSHTPDCTQSKQKGEKI